MIFSIEGKDRDAMRATSSSTTTASRPIITDGKYWPNQSLLETARRLFISTKSISIGK